MPCDIDFYEEIGELKEEIEQLRHAVGVMTTIKPDMEIDVRDPVGMALQVVEHVEQLRHDAWNDAIEAAALEAEKHVTMEGYEQEIALYIRKLKRP